MPGTLFVVATPIGNLEDLTFRARRILGEVDLIAAEDTRRTSKLLAHYEIRKPMVSLREHNEVRESPRLVARMQAGESIALVTDAGTPGIADPGARLVKAARAGGVTIVPIPGASAVATAMSISGAEAPEFSFYGFPPPKGTEREDWFRRLAGTPHPSVFFEAPHRIERTLSECSKYLVDQQIIVSRELTKLNETLVIYPNTSSIGRINPIGEFVVVVIPEIDSGKRQRQTLEIQQEALNLFSVLSAAPGISEDLAIELTALKLALTPTDARKAVKKAKILVKQQNR
jgi:16S rRNA (cytidine1402-2'-O)-methyltransferase